MDTAVPLALQAMQLMAAQRSSEDQHKAGTHHSALAAHIIQMRTAVDQEKVDAKKAILLAVIKAAEFIFHQRMDASAVWFEALRAHVEVRRSSLEGELKEARRRRREGNFDDRLLARMRIVDIDQEMENLDQLLLKTKIVYGRIGTFNSSVSKENFEYNTDLVFEKFFRDVVKKGLDNIAKQTSDKLAQATSQENVSVDRLRGILTDALDQLKSLETDTSQANSGNEAKESRVGAQLASPKEPPKDKAGAEILWATHKLENVELPDTPPAFIKRHYGPWLGKGLTRANIGKIDPPLYRALTRFINDTNNRDHADLKDFDLPTPQEVTDRRIDAVKRAAEEGRPLPLPADRKAMTALARAMERREKEARGNNR